MCILYLYIQHYIIYIYIYIKLKKLEKIVYYQFIHFLNCFNILDPIQHVFRPNHSTETTIIQLMGNHLI